MDEDVRQAGSVESEDESTSCEVVEEVRSDESGEESKRSWGDVGSADKDEIEGEWL